jgi:NAD(P)H-dependent flavin oxidoreductase YrpB (nitropropane dioxygenase family)
MRGVRRFSQAISEGDGISLLADVADAAAARQAELHGAEGLVVRGAADGVHEATNLPICLYGRLPAFDGEADAVVVEASEDEHWAESVVRLAEDSGVECVVKVRDEDELQLVLDRLDPEIFLLSAREDSDHDRLEQVLGLLPDVPAGKLAVAEVGSATPALVAELERAGVDAVIVSPGVVSDFVAQSH